MVYAAGIVPLHVSFKMTPVILMLVCELGLSVVHTVQAETVKVLPDYSTCSFHSTAPVSTASRATLSFRRGFKVVVEVGELVKDVGNRITLSSLIDGKSAGFLECM